MQLTGLQKASPVYKKTYFWEVVAGVCRPAPLILTLFQSNIYKVNVREYPPGDFVSKNKHYQLLTW